MANEFRRLAKGVRNIMKTGTETIEFIKNTKHHPPANHRYVRETIYLKKTPALTKIKKYGQFAQVY